MENKKMCYFVQYRSPHFGSFEPSKDILQVHNIPLAEAERIKANWPQEKISAKPMVYIAPMGKYIYLPLILETLPDDFRTPKEFWDQKKYWD